MNNNTESLMKKTFVYLAGNFSSKFFGLLIIPIYAEYLSTNQLGAFDYQVTVGNLLQPIILLAIWEAILRFGLNAEKEELNVLISTSLFFSVIMLLLALILLLPTYFIIYSVDIKSLLYVLMIIFMPLITTLGYISRAVKNSRVYAVSGVVSAGVNFAGIMILVVFLKLSILGLLLSTLLANIFNAVFLIIGAKIPKYFDIQYVSKKEFILLVTFSAPLVLNLVFGWFTSSFSRFYINLSIGNHAGGLYAFAMKFSTIIMQIAGIVNMTMIEDAVLTSTDNNWTRKFEENNNSVINLFFQISFLIIPLIGIYYQSIKNNIFYNSLYIVPITILIALFMNISTLIGNIFPVFKKNGKVFMSSLISGVSNVLLSVVFGKFFGIFGILLAQLAAAIILVLYRYIEGRKIREYNLNIKNILINCLIFLIISGITLVGNIYFQLIEAVFCLVIFIIMYFNFIKHIINALNKKRR